MQPLIRRPLSYLISALLLLLLSVSLSFFLPLPSVLLFCIFAKFVKTKKEILGRKNVYKKPVLFCYLCDYVCVYVCVCMWVSFPCVCVPVRELYALRSGFVILFFCAADFGYVNLRAQTTTTTRGAGLVCNLSRGRVRGS